MRLLILLGALLLLESAQSYKVLVYSPRFSQSINNFLGNIADTLVDAGHDVTTLIPIINPQLRDGTLKSKKIYLQPTEEVNKIAESMNFEDADFFGYDDFNLIQSVAIGSAYITWVAAHCKGVLDELGMIDKLREEKFDVMIVEVFEVCGTALSHLIKPKSLITTSGSAPFGWMNHEFGLDLAVSNNPSMVLSNLDVHSFWSRLTNIYAEFIVHLTWMKSRTLINNLFQERFENFPGVQEISSHAAFSFVNSEPLIDFAVPTLNRVIYIGGIGAKTPKKLDDDLDRLFTLRNKTVLISFGSVVFAHKLPLKVKQTIVEVVSRCPEVTFQWKYEKPEDDFAKSVLPSTPNLHMLKWTPQNDILADDRLSAFITHGGMASTQETALRGKPGLFIPFMGDQPRNAGMMERSGVGKKLYAAVKDLIENDSYRQAALRNSELIQKKPLSARETLIRTVEFAAQFGPSPALRPQSFDMSWIEYHNLDIIAVLFVISIIGALVALKTVLFVATKLSTVVKFKLE